MGKSSSGRRPDERPAGKAKPDVCAVSDGKAGAYCTVGLVLSGFDSIFSPYAALTCSFVFRQQKRL